MKKQVQVKHFHFWQVMVKPERLVDGRPDGWQVGPSNCYLGYEE